MDPKHKAIPQNWLNGGSTSKTLAQLLANAGRRFSLSGEQYDDHCFVRDPVDLVNCPVDVTAMRSVHPVLGHSFLFLHPPYCFYTAACDPNIA